MPPREGPPLSTRSSWWRRIVSPIGEFGAILGSIYVVGRVLARISSHLSILIYELVVQPIPQTPILPQRLARNLTARELQPGDPDLGVVLAPSRVQQMRFAQRAICLATYSKSDIIGYIWLCFGSYEEDEARCTFVVSPSETAVFDFDLVVLPQYRMGLGFAGLWHCTSEYLSRRGIRCTFSRITRFNVASRRAHAHLGCKKVGDLVVLKLWSVEILVSTVAPYFHVSVGKKGRARVRLYADTPPA